MPGIEFIDHPGSVFANQQLDFGHWRTRRRTDAQAALINRQTNRSPAPPPQGVMNDALAKKNAAQFATTQPRSRVGFDTRCAAPPEGSAPER